MRNVAPLRQISGLALSVMLALGIVGFIRGETQNTPGTRESPASIPSLDEHEPSKVSVKAQANPPAHVSTATSNRKALDQVTDMTSDLLISSQPSTFFGYQVYRDRTFTADGPGYYILYNRWMVTQSNATIAYTIILHSTEGFHIKPLVGVDQNGRGHVHIRVTNPNLRAIHYLYSVDSVHRLVSDRRSLEDVTLADLPEPPFNSKNSVRAGNSSWFDRYFAADPGPSDSFAYFFSLHPVGLRGEEILTVEVFITLKLVSREG